MSVQIAWINSFHNKGIHFNSILNGSGTERFWARFPSMGVDHVDRSVVSVEEMGPGYVYAELRYTMYDYRNGVIDIGK